MLFDLNVLTYIILLLLVISFYGLFGEVINVLHKKHYKKNSTGIDTSTKRLSIIKDSIW